MEKRQKPSVADSGAPCNDLKDSQPGQKGNKDNHWAVMILTCIVPFAVLAVLIFAFKVKSVWLTWIALAICLGSHVWMMKSMHKHDAKGGGCH